MAHPLFPDDLDALETALWGHLTRGAADKHSSLRWPALSTTAADGAPQSRIVVLRKADRDLRRLTVYSDRRTRKIERLRSRPAAALLFFDPGHMIQIRVESTAKVHLDGPRFEEEWEIVKSGRTSDYSAEPAPGTAIPVGDDYDTGRADAAEQFAVIDAHVTALEALHLSREGHRRALFSYEANPSGCWLVP